MDINQRVDQLESMVVDYLQKSDQLADYVRQILSLTTSIETKTELAAQALVRLLDNQMDQSEVAAQMDAVAQQFIDLMQTQQAIISLLSTRFDEAN